MKQILLVLFLFLVSTTIAEAQFFNSLQPPQIKTVPAYPEPFATVEASLDAYAFDTNGASIVWFINGVEMTDAKNKRNVTLSVGALGIPTTLTAQVTLTSGQVLNAVKEIIPARVDVVIEADTTKPLHYKGRALPSSGSMVRAVALPQVGQSLESLSYKWSLNNKVLQGGSRVGGNDITFEAPLSGSAILTVEVSDSLGALITKKNLELRVVNPELYFYEDNPLRGLSRNAIVDRFQLIGEEISVRAEPYFMATDIYDSNPHMEWKVNGRTIENPSRDQQVVTLRSEGGVGTFAVNFHIRNLQDLLQGVRNEFVVAF